MNELEKGRLIETLRIKTHSFQTRKGVTHGDGREILEKKLRRPDTKRIHRGNLLVLLIIFI